MTVEKKPPPYILPVIVVSQFAGTSLWFAGNGVLQDLISHFRLPETAVGTLTGAVQFGFITGTLIFAITALSDRWSGRALFLACALLGALANLGMVFWARGLISIAAFRFATGFFLAGVYPIGMKIAAGWFRRDLGRAIGFLVGALVLGTAFPHLAKALGQQYPWQIVIYSVSALAATGGALLWFTVPDGPYASKGTPFNPKAVAAIFKSKQFRASAFGYFGHMWELYAFWAFLPLWLAAYLAEHQGLNWNLSLTTFIIMAAGFFGCIGAGWWSLKIGSAPVAARFLATSGLCCFFSPLAFALPPGLFLGFLLIWGTAVIGDSGQFSALNAQKAPPLWVGSALTSVTCIGFALTIFSIQLLSRLSSALSPQWTMWPLTLGPALGLLAFRPLLNKQTPTTKE